MNSAIGKLHRQNFTVQ